MQQNRINETHQVSPVNAFFIVTGSQIVVNILKFQSVVTEDAEQDAWISVLLMGLGTLLVMWCILRLLNNEQNYGQPDLFSIHKRFFGSWIGNLLNLAIILYEALGAILYLRAYIEILNVWLFPRLSPLGFAAIFSLLIWTVVIGGFRTITGTFFLNFIYLLPLYFINTFIFSDAHFSNLLPIADHSLADLSNSLIKASSCFLGFESILFYYPFIKRPKLAVKWCYFGLLNTTYTYLLLTIQGLVYFNIGELRTLVWPVLTFWKSIHFPLVDRFEYIGIIYWLTVLIPNVSLGAWIVSRGVKQIAPVIKQKYALVAFLLILTAVCAIIQSRPQIEWINALISHIGFYLVFVYIPFLLIWQWLLKIKEGKSQ